MVSLSEQDQGVFMTDSTEICINCNHEERFHCTITQDSAIDGTRQFFHQCSISLPTQLCKCLVFLRPPIPKGGSGFYWDKVSQQIYTCRGNTPVPNIEGLLKLQPSPKKEEHGKETNSGQPT